MMVNLVRALHDHGQQTTLVVAGTSEDAVFHDPDLNIVYLGCSRVMASLGPLRRWLARCRPSHLLATMEHTNLVAVLATRGMRDRPRVFLREANTPSRNHGGRSIRSRLIPMMQRRLYPLADGIIAVSDGVRRDMVGFLALSDAKIEVVHNPVVTDAMLAAAREEPRHPWLQDKRVPVILAVGRLNRQKDFATLLSAFAICRKQRVLRLLILGEGDLRKELEQQVESLNLEREVAMPGFTDDVYASLGNADLFVLSSRWEGSPNALVEALACGCRAVATDCPSGPREILRGGVHGALVPPGDPPALATAILESLDRQADPGTSIYVRETYGARFVARQYCEILAAERS